MSTAAIETTAPRTAAIGKATGTGRTDAQAWGLAMILPYVLIFLAFVLYPVLYAFWLARSPAVYSKLIDDPIFWRTIVNTLVFVGVAISVKMVIALMLSGFFTTGRWWVKGLMALFILPWALPSIPTILSFRFMLNPEWGIINQQIFRLTGPDGPSWLQPIWRYFDIQSLDGPNWLNDPTLALGLAMVVHVWKSLPFWTVILISGRLAISKDLYEAASVDGAGSWHLFRHITWPSMQQLFYTCLILSMIWTVGDFNSVYLLTGGGPGDLTHVLATLGVRYLRFDKVDQSMAAIVVALPLVLPLVYVLMRRLGK